MPITKSKGCAQNVEYAATCCISGSESPSVHFKSRQDDAKKVSMHIFYTLRPDETGTKPLVCRGDHSGMMYAVFEHARLKNQRCI
jgi:hypothetical protein